MGPSLGQNHPLWMIISKRKRKKKTKQIKISRRKLISELAVIVSMKVAKHCELLANDTILLTDLENLTIMHLQVQAGYFILVDAQTIGQRSLFS